MGRQWFYAREGVKRGPISSETLRKLAATGALRDDDLVWFDGMPKWTPARKITGLFPSEPSTMPPLPMEMNDGKPHPMPDIQNSMIASPFDAELMKKAKDSAVKIANELADKLDIQPSAIATLAPFWVGLAILCFFPLGLFLLWKNAALKDNKTWWRVGCAWSLLMLLGMIVGDKDKSNPDGNQGMASTPASNRKDDPPSGDNVSDGIKTYRVSKGFLQGSLSIQVPELLGIELSDFKWDSSNFLQYVVVWDLRKGYKPTNMRWTSHDSKGTKVDGGDFDFGNTISSGEATRGHFRVGSFRKAEVAKIKIF